MGIWRIGIGRVGRIGGDGTTWMVEGSARIGIRIRIGIGRIVEMPVRKVGSGFEVFLKVFQLRLASNQLIHAYAGNPVPLSKVPGQAPSAFDSVCGALEQVDQQFSGALY